MTPLSGLDTSQQPVSLLRLYSIAKQQLRRILLPEQGDPRVIEACNALVEHGLVTPLVLRRENTQNLPEGIEVFNECSNRDDWIAKAVEALVQTQQHKGMTSTAAFEALSDPLLLAACLVKVGYADAGVAGSQSTTADVLRAGLKGIGASDDCPVVSSALMMNLPAPFSRIITYSDCAVLPTPNAQQLAQIAIASAHTHEQLTGEIPKVALLSFSSKGSANDPSLDKIKQALKLAQALQPGLIIDGEIQFDAAFDPSVGARKTTDSPIAGQANVFIFPDLNAANIGCKITECLGGATSIGPILQGFSKPWLDLSRGCKSIDIFNTAVIAANLIDGIVD